MLKPAREASGSLAPSPWRRHGWGCEPEPEKAVSVLSAAASNSAAVEQLALQAGLKKGGAAKGELVLAIFELANCFRHGWGTPKDPLAARQVSALFAAVATQGEGNPLLTATDGAVLRNGGESRRHG